MESDQRKADSQACEFRNFRRRRKALLQLKASCSLDDENYPRRRKTKSTNYREMSSMLVLSNENASSSEIVAADGQMSSSCEETTRSSSSEEEENNNNRNVLTKLKCGSVSMMGRRRTMEDTFTMAPEIVSGRFSFFAVYDGHGGAGVANACRDRLHKLLEDDLATILTEGTEATGGDNWTAIMKTCFSKMDDEVILKDEDGAIILGEKSGSTATVVVVGVEEMVVANCGDSRAVLCRGGIAVPLSTDHKSNRPDEVERVEAAGGVIVDWNGCRVEGVLAISRSIGDYYLRPYVISEPTVTVNRRHESDEFIILATDGLWDVMSNEVACNIVRKRFNGRNRKKTKSVADVATFLAEVAIAKGSEDDVSVIVVKLENES